MDFFVYLFIMLPFCNTAVIIMQNILILSFSVIESPIRQRIKKSLPDGRWAVPSGKSIRRVLIIVIVAAVMRLNIDCLKANQANWRERGSLQS